MRFHELAEEVRRGGDSRPLGPPTRLAMDGRRASGYDAPMSFDFFDLLAFLLDWGYVAAPTVEKAVDDARLARVRAQRLAELRAQLAACPMRDVTGAPDGPGAFEGVARPLALTSAPLSGRPIIGCRLRLEG